MKPGPTLEQLEALADRVETAALDAEAAGAYDLETDLQALLADVLEMKQEVEERPEVVCLCGSTRFKDEFRRENARLTLEGSIVLSVGFFHHAGEAPGGVEGDAEAFEASATKEELDELHKRKIDLADRVHVIDVDGYVGESTESEVAYARRTGTPVTWFDGGGDV